MASFVDPHLPSPSHSYDYYSGRRRRNSVELTYEGHASMRHPDHAPHHQRVELEDDDESKRIYGTWDGVFARDLIEILNVVLLLRTGSIVGKVGIIKSYFLIIVAGGVAFITTLSMSAICTNGNVKAGGAYYMISRAIGVTRGGSVGILFALCSCIGLAYHAAAFAETLRFTIDSSTTRDDFRFYGLLLIFGSFLVVRLGLLWRFQMASLAVVGAVLVLFIAGSAIVKDESQGITGYSDATARSNLWPQSSFQEFLTALGIFFPAVTGIMSGANRSGELKNPAIDIPKGTPLALAVGLIIYILAHTIIGCVVVRTTENGDEGLQNDNFIFVDICIWSPFALAAIFITTFSSTLGSCISAHRIISAIAKDKLVPEFFVKSDTRIYITIFVISSAFVCVGNLDEISLIISMVSLLLYTLLNYSVAALEQSRSPWWRPSFGFHSMYTSLFGAASCMVLMFLIDWRFALVAFALMAGIYYTLKNTHKNMSKGPAQVAMNEYVTIRYMMQLRKTAEYASTIYRPHFLLLNDGINHESSELQLLSCMSRGGSAIFMGSVVTSKTSHHRPPRRSSIRSQEEQKNQMKDVMDDNTSVENASVITRTHSFPKYPARTSVSSTAKVQSIAVHIDPPPFHNVNGKVKRIKNVFPLMAIGNSKSTNKKEGNRAKDDIKIGESKSQPLQVVRQKALEGKASHSSNRIFGESNNKAMKDAKGKKVENTARRNADSELVESKTKIVSSNDDYLMDTKHKIQVTSTREDIVSISVVKDSKDTTGVDEEVGHDVEPDHPTEKTSRSTLKRTISTIRNMFDRKSHRERKASVEESNPDKAKKVNVLRSMFDLKQDSGHLHVEDALYTTNHSTIPRAQGEPAFSQSLHNSQRDRRDSLKRERSSSLRRNRRDSIPRDSLRGDSLRGDSLRRDSLRRDSLPLNEQNDPNGRVSVLMPRGSKPTPPFTGYIAYDTKMLKVRAFEERLQATNFYEGAWNLLQTCGMGRLRPNVVALRFPADWKSLTMKKKVAYVRIIQDSIRLHKGIMLMANFPESWSMLSEKAESKDSTKPFIVDIWWLTDSGGLILLLPYLLQRHRLWRKAKIRLFSITDNAQRLTNDERALSALLSSLRIPWEENLTILPTGKGPKPESLAKWSSCINVNDSKVTNDLSRWIRISELIEEHSSDQAQLAFVTMPVPRRLRNSYLPETFSTKLEALASHNIPTVFVRGSGRNVLTFSLDK